MVSLILDVLPLNLPSVGEMFLYPLLLFFVYREIRKRDTQDKAHLDNLKEIMRIDGDLRSVKNKMEYLEEGSDDHEKRLRKLEEKKS